MQKQDENAPATVEPKLQRQAEMTFEELPVEAQLRFIHAGRWVAWAADDQSVIAVGDDPIEVREAARRAGAPEAICEWILPAVRNWGRL